MLQQSARGDRVLARQPRFHSLRSYLAMATSAQRRITPKEIRRFGSGREPYAIPDLTEIQTRSYEAFLQYDIACATSARTRASKACCAKSSRSRATTRRCSWNTSATSWASRATSRDECRQLRLTYGRPFRVWLRLTKEQPIEEEVYLGDMPIMLGGGEFIINGAERVVVSQLHRSPGVDFVTEMEAGERKHAISCRIIPERGSWIELNITQERHAQRPHRPERQVLGHDAAAGDGPEVQPGRRPVPRVLRDDDAKRSSTAAASARSKARSRSTTSSIRPTAIGPARSSSKRGQKITKNVAEIDLHLRPDSRSR